MVELLLRGKANTKVLAMDSFTPLHFAAQRSNLGAIHLLVKADKTLMEARTSKGNKTALHLALLKDNADAVNILLQLGASTTAKLSNGQTCVDISKSESCLKAIQAKREELKAKHPKKPNSSVDTGNVPVDDDKTDDNDTIRFSAAGGGVALPASLLTSEGSEEVGQGDQGGARTGDVEEAEGSACERREGNCAASKGEGVEDEARPLKKARNGNNVILSHLENFDEV